MQTIKSQNTENLGYMAPISVVRHFFDDIQDGQYDGFPNLGVSIQTMENPDLKKKYGLTDEQTGVLINRVFPGSPAENVLRRGDVLSKIEGHPVADDGTIEFRPKERTSFAYYVDLRQIGDEIELEIFRDGQSEAVRIPLNRTRGEYTLVPSEQYETLPRYFIYGGIVFTPLTKNLIESYGPNWPQNAPPQLVAELGNWVTTERQEVVLALRILADEVNQGYDLFAWIVSEVNDQKFKNFDEFFRLVMDSRDQYLVLCDEEAYELVLDRVKAEAAHTRILDTYRIEHDRSPDLQEHLTMD